MQLLLWSDVSLGKFVIFNHFYYQPPNIFLHYSYSTLFSLCSRVLCEDIAYHDLEEFP
jgi:hypothetical protein